MKLFDYTIRVWRLQSTMTQALPEHIAALPIKNVARKEIEHFARTLSRLVPGHEVTVTKHVPRCGNEIISRLRNGKHAPIHPTEATS